VNKKQRESAAKYLYDISKGIFLVVVVGNMLKDKVDIVNIVIGFWATIIFFLWAYSIEGGVKDG
jgi:uncharacterized membrane protein (Fun14 family)